MSERRFRSFSYRGAHYQANSCAYSPALRTIRRERGRLEEYIRRNPAFAEAFEPLSEIGEDAPESAGAMHRASLLFGVGPMAAVAGTFAHAAAQAAIDTGCREAVIENGGDLFLILRSPLILALYPGAESRAFSQLAFSVQPEDTPLAVCSSSSVMGHSASLGRADLCTVFAREGAVADAAATKGANSIHSAEDLQGTVEALSSVKGVQGAVAVFRDQIALAGKIPEIIKHQRRDLASRISKDPLSNFS